MSTTPNLKMDWQIRKIEQMFTGGGQSIIFLTNNRNTLPLYDWLCFQEESVALLSEKMEIFHLEKHKPDFIISYNYNHLIGREMIRLLPGKMINLHISLLPWNRGSDPNFWSFMENTPKGVTIHQIDEGLDTGDIIVQQECYFDEGTETLRSTYDSLQREVKALFMKNWGRIRNHEIIPQAQSMKGSYHQKRDFGALTKNIQMSWDESITDVKKKLKKVS